MKLGARSHTVWIGDGGNFPGQVHFRRALERYLESLRAIYAALPDGFRMFIEHKLYEPAFYSTVLNDWGTSYYCTRELGPKALLARGPRPPRAQREHRDDRGPADPVREAGRLPLQRQQVRRRRPRLRLDQALPALPRSSTSWWTPSSSRSPGFDPAYMLDQSHNVTDPIESLMTSAVELVRAYVQAHLVDRAALREAPGEQRRDPGARAAEAGLHRPTWRRSWRWRATARAGRSTPSARYRASGYRAAQGRGAAGGRARAPASSERAAGRSEASGRSVTWRSTSAPAAAGRCSAGVAEAGLALRGGPPLPLPAGAGDGHLRWPFGAILDGLEGRASPRRSARPRRRGPIESVGVDSLGRRLRPRSTRAAGSLEDPVCYRDHRTDGAIERVLRNGAAGGDLRSAPGIQFLQFNTLFQLYAHVREGLPARRAAPADDPRPVPPRALRLDAAASTRTPRPRSSSTCGRGAWADDLFSRLALPRELCRSSSRPGRRSASCARLSRRSSGSAALRVIAPATHDTGSAVAGTPLEPGWAYISSGTWSLVGVERTAPLLGDAVARANFTNEGGAFGTVRFLKNVMGLWILESCRQRVGGARAARATSRRCSQAAAALERSPGLVFPDDPRFFNPASMTARAAGGARRDGPAGARRPGAARARRPRLARPALRVGRAHDRGAHRRAGARDPRRGRRLPQRVPEPGHGRRVGPAGAGRAGRGDRHRQPAAAGDRLRAARLARRRARLRGSEAVDPRRFEPRERPGWTRGGRALPRDRGARYGARRRPPSGSRRRCAPRAAAGRRGRRRRATPRAPRRPRGGRRRAPRSRRGPSANCVPRPAACAGCGWPPRPQRRPPRSTIRTPRPSNSSQSRKRSWVPTRKPWTRPASEAAARSPGAPEGAGGRAAAAAGSPGPCGSRRPSRAAA